MTPTTLFRDVQPGDTVVSAATIAVTDFYNDPFLKKLITEALDSNLNVRIALNRLAQASQYVKQSDASLLPTLSLGVSGSLSNVSKYGNTARPADPPITDLKLSASASWEADIWGKLRHARKAQVNNYLQQEATVNATRTQIVANVASAYYQLITLDRQKEVTLRNIESYTRYLETVKSLKNSAQVTEVAVLQAQAQLSAAQAYLPQIEASIASNENYLCTLLGKAPAAVPRSSDIDLTLFHNELLHTGLPAQLLAARPDVQAAEYALRSSHEAFNVSRAAMYPQLILSAGGGTEAKSIANWFNLPGSLFWNAVAGLTQPVFNGRTLKTAREIARLQEDASLLNFKQTLITAGNEVSTALSGIRFTTRQAGFQKEQVEALKKAYEYSQELLVNGYATYLEVLSAQNSVLSSELSLYSTYNSIVQQKITLYRALGGGWR
jgi:NodT family efflux transporter outer membrane factor (OMF) lipoprotein